MIHVYHHHQWQDDFIGRKTKDKGQKQDAVWFFQLEKRYYAIGEDSTEEEQQRNRWEEDALNLIFIRQPDHFYCPCTVEFFDRDGALLSTLELNGGAARP